MSKFGLGNFLKKIAFSRSCSHRFILLGIELYKCRLFLFPDNSVCFIDCLKILVVKALEWLGFWANAGALHSWDSISAHSIVLIHFIDLFLGLLDVFWL